MQCSVWGATDDTQLSLPWEAEKEDRRFQGFWEGVQWLVRIANTRVGSFPHHSLSLIEPLKSQGEGQHPKAVKIGTLGQPKEGYKCRLA